MIKGGIGSHTKAYHGVKDEWITPKYILDELGPFDLDPCSAVNQPWATALTQWTIEDDGLSKEWFGRVWMNPPYGNFTNRWLEKMSNHNDGIVLIFARTETKMFFDYIWNKAAAILFIEGRLTFFNVDGSKGKGNSGGPSVLVAYGENNVDFLHKSKIPGKLIIL